MQSGRPAFGRRMGISNDVPGKQADFAANLADAGEIWPRGRPRCVRGWRVDSVDAALTSAANGIYASYTLIVSRVSPAP